MLFPVPAPPLPLGKVSSGSPEMQKTLSSPTSQWAEQAITMESSALIIGKGSFPSILPELSLFLQAPDFAPVCHQDLWIWTKHVPLNPNFILSPTKVTLAMLTLWSQRAHDSTTLLFGWIAPK